MTYLEILKKYGRPVISDNNHEHQHIECSLYTFDVPSQLYDYDYGLCEAEAAQCVVSNLADELLTEIEIIEYERS